MGRNEICLTSSTGECKSNKKLSKKRRLPCQPGSTTPIQHKKRRKTYLSKNSKTKLKIDHTANDENKNKDCIKRKLMDNRNNTNEKKQKLDKACQTSRKKRGFF